MWIVRHAKLQLYRGGAALTDSDGIGRRYSITNTIAISFTCPSYGVAYRCPNSGAYGGVREVRSNPGPTSGNRS